MYSPRSATQGGQDRWPPPECEYEPTAADVLAEIEDSGVFDNLRKEVLAEIKGAEDMKNLVFSLVASSKTLDENQTRLDILVDKDKKQIRDELNAELGSRVDEEAYKRAWEILTKHESIAPKLNAAVHAALSKVTKQRIKAMQADADARSAVASADSMRAKLPVPGRPPP